MNPAAPTFRVTRDGRCLNLLRGDECRLSLPLDQGGRHRLVVGDNATARQVLAALEDCPDVGVLPGGGGLLGAMTVADNFILALRYGSDDDAGNLRELDRDLAVALGQCGLPAERIATLGRELPMNLERTDRWTLGFVRMLLRPPELLVIDRLFAGLTRRQAEALIATEAIYHARHPFRPVLFMDLDSHELPALPDCRTLIADLDARGETVENPCHC